VSEWRYLHEVPAIGAFLQVNVADTRDGGLFLTHSLTHSDLLDHSLDPLLAHSLGANTPHVALVAVAVVSASSSLGHSNSTISYKSYK
jgi:hypothetical protein